MTWRLTSPNRPTSSSYLGPNTDSGTAWVQAKDYNNVRLQSALSYIATGESWRQAGIDEVFQLHHSWLRCGRRTECGSMSSTRHRGSVRKGGRVRPRLWSPSRHGIQVNGHLS